MPNIKKSGTKKFEKFFALFLRVAAARRFFGVFAADLLVVVVIFLFRFAIFIFTTEKFSVFAVVN
jgi:hypothetical protein